jgi:hypothetical protein
MLSSVSCNIAYEIYLFWVFGLFWLFMPMIVKGYSLCTGPYGRFYRAKYNIYPFQIVMINKAFLSINNSSDFSATLEQQLVKTSLNNIHKLMLLAPYDPNDYITLGINFSTTEQIMNYFPILEDKFRTNCFSMMPFNNTSVILNGSFFNHSCDSNLCYIGLFGYIFFVANRFIKKGEELTISYASFDSDTKYTERQAQLSKVWHFTCNCSKCQSEMIQNGTA